MSSQFHLRWLSSQALAITVLVLWTAIARSAIQDEFGSSFQPAELALATEAHLSRQEGSHRMVTEFTATTDPTSEVPDEKSAPQISSASDTDPVAAYLWDVYQRSPAKRDGHGDFTWKDQSAAERMGISVQEYVIGGMEPDFRELLYHAGLAMDLAGIRWTILSGFRDDYRQSIAAGFKAHPGNSFHGGSIATGGYGHGCAVDLASVDGLSNQDVWQWLAAHGAEFRLERPLAGLDPAHVQPRGGWHELAAALRQGRIVREKEKVDEKTSLVTPMPGTAKDGLPMSLEPCTRARLLPPQSNRTSATVTGQASAFTRTPAGQHKPQRVVERAVQNRPVPPDDPLDAPVLASRQSNPALPSAGSNQMWFIQLAGGTSESVALGAYYRLQRKFAQVLGAYRPVIAQGETGYRWYRARIAMNTRESATKVCASLRAAGGDCLVLPR